MFPIIPAISMLVPEIGCRDDKIMKSIHNVARQRMKYNNNIFNSKITTMVSCFYYKLWTWSIMSDTGGDIPMTKLLSFVSNTDGGIS